MGGMAAALCFSCFRSRGFWGELSRASLAVFRRLGLVDSNLQRERRCPSRVGESGFSGLCKRQAPSAQELVSANTSTGGE